jgi:hypothetical protein
MTVICTKLFNFLLMLGVKEVLKDYHFTYFFPILRQFIILFKVFNTTNKKYFS